MIIQKLRDLTIKQFLTAKPNPNSTISDGQGLYLIIRPSGLPYWIYRFRVRQGGIKQDSTFTIGKYPEVSLVYAREKLMELRGIVARGHNPKSLKRPTNN